MRLRISTKLQRFLNCVSPSIEGGAVVLTMRMKQCDNEMMVIVVCR